MRRLKLKFDFRNAICIFICSWLIYVTFVFMFNKYSRVSYYESQIDKSSKTHKLVLDLKEIKEFRMKRFNDAQSRSKFITGPGEDGKPVILTDDEQAKASASFSFEAFNAYASDKIAMDRRIPDIRHPDCQNKKYTPDLPTASVVIVFCNESTSGLLRTVHSVVNRSPPQYLEEVILVDDYSSKPGLGRPLEDYITSTWPDSIVSLHRSKQRLGLIRAKIWGAELSVGEVVVFLDAHCEVGHQWLEPLLSRIKEKPMTVVCPMVDSISDRTLEYSRDGGSSVGGFTWNLHFTWRPALNNSTKPVRSPTMPGGLLAVGRSFFFSIGAYDRGMFTWGGENLEMSFRVWMCGGELEFIPCSRVGHVFRDGHPYNFDNSDSHGYNSKRVAEVWLDGYKKYFYKHRPDLVMRSVGDLSERYKIRTSLKCKTFKWYLDNVFPNKFIMDVNSQAYGEVTNVGENMCLDTFYRGETKNLGQFRCLGGLSQTFGLSRTNELRTDELCLDVKGAHGASVLLYDCHEMGGNQLWHYSREVMTLTHNSGYCLDIGSASSGGNITVKICVYGSPSQKWKFQHIIGFI